MAPYRAQVEKEPSKSNRAPDKDNTTMQSNPRIVFVLMDLRLGQVPHVYDVGDVTADKPQLIYTLYTI